MLWPKRVKTPRGTWLEECWFPSIVIVGPKSTGLDQAHESVILVITFRRLINKEWNIPIKRKGLVWSSVWRLSAYSDLLSPHGHYPFKKADLRVEAVVEACHSLYPLPTLWFVYFVRRNKPTSPSTGIDWYFLLSLFLFRCNQSSDNKAPKAREWLLLEPAGPKSVLLIIIK